MSVRKNYNNAPSRDLLSKSLTGAKPKIITGTTATAIDAYAIQFVTECTLTALSGNIKGTVTSVTYPAGLIIYGQFSSITLGAADDTVVVYQN
jgi:hypothetical protein